ncbi:hypothetical protein CCH79_00016419 [Gambusia affinis]|uniref:Kelch domain-containing protein 8B n=1 Tax=Gambusia affinis TaxID=33528 RepID=A0A315WAW0_GAMAF|nr:hypothetical protein CCH79_00016419 [Gambusia affinis]
MWRDEIRKLIHLSNSGVNDARQAHEAEKDGCFKVHPRSHDSHKSGGRQGKMPVTALEAFDLEMKSWTRYPCIPSRRAFSCCAANERSLFSLGGLQQPGPHNFYSRPHFVSTTEEFDLDQELSGLLVLVLLCIPRTRTKRGEAHGCYPQSMNIYGITQKPWMLISGSYETLQPACAFLKLHWIHWIPLSHNSLLCPGQARFIIQHVSKQMQIPRTVQEHQGTQCEDLCKLPSPTPAMTLLAKETRSSNEPSPLGSVESYNPVKRRWEYVAPMPTARCSSALLQTTSILFVIGGVAQGPSNAVEALCLQETSVVSVNANAANNLYNGINDDASLHAFTPQATLVKIIRLPWPDSNRSQCLCIP